MNIFSANKDQQSPKDLLVKTGDIPKYRDSLHEKNLLSSQIPPDPSLQIPQNSPGARDMGTDFDNNMKDGKIGNIDNSSINLHQSESNSNKKEIEEVRNLMGKPSEASNSIQFQEYKPLKLSEIQMTSEKHMSFSQKDESRQKSFQIKLNNVESQNQNSQQDSKSPKGFALELDSNKEALNSIKEVKETQERSPPRKTEKSFHLEEQITMRKKELGIHYGSNINVNENLLSGTPKAGPSVSGTPKVEYISSSALMKVPLHKVAAKSMDQVTFSSSLAKSKTMRNNNAYTASDNQAPSSIYGVATQEGQEETSRGQNNYDAIDSARNPILEKVKFFKPPPMSYESLRGHLIQTQPINPKTQRNLSFCCSTTTARCFWCKLICLPYYICCSCCSRKQDASNGETTPSILTEGVSLYLQMVKTVCLLLTAITIINLPLYYIFYNNVGDGYDPTAHEFNDIFYEFSLANLGVSYQDANVATLFVGQYSLECPCDSVESTCLSLEDQQQVNEEELQVKDSLKLECQSNSMIGKINDFGLINFSGFDRSTEVDVDGLLSNIRSPTYTPKTFDILTELEEKVKFEKESAERLNYNSDQVNPYNIDSHCNIEGLFQTQSTQNEIKAYMADNCIGQKSCYISGALLVELVADFSCDCRQRIGLQKSLSQLMVVYTCDAEQIPIPYFEQAIKFLQKIKINKARFDQMMSTDLSSYKASKSEMLRGVVILDLCCIFLVFYVILRLDSLNNDLIKEIKWSIQEIQDFTLQISSLSLDLSCQDERILHLKLWTVINNLIQDHKIEHVNIIDISLASVQFENMQRIQKLQDLFVEKTHTQQEMEHQSTNNQKRDSLFNKIQKLEEEYKEAHQQFQSNKSLQLGKGQEGGNDDGNKKQKIVQMVDYVFVTVDTNRAKEEIQQKGRITFLDKNFRFEEKVLAPENIVWSNLKGEPYIPMVFCGNIWFFLRWALKFGLVGVVHLVLFYVVLELDHILNTDTECPEMVTDETSFKQHLYFQYLDQVREQSLLTSYHGFGGNYEYLGCYCDYLKNGGSQDYLSTTFKDVDPEGKDEIQYCVGYFKSKKVIFYTRLLYPIFVSIIGDIIHLIFKSCPQESSFDTTIQESKSMFYNEFVFDAFNSGFMFLISSLLMNVEEYLGEEFITVHFDPHFYKRLAPSICLALVFSLARNILQDIFKAIKIWYFRSMDRKFKCSITRQGDDLNTQCRTQEQLNYLYTGPVFEIEKQYALVASKLFVVLIFSVGMPFLYPILLLFLIIKYIQDRCLTMSFYRTFEWKVKDELAKCVLNMALLGIFFHFLIGIMMVADPGIQRSYEEVDDQSIEAMKLTGIDWLPQMSKQDKFKLFFNRRVYSFQKSFFKAFFIGFVTFIVLWFLASIKINCNCKCKKKSKNQEDEQILTQPYENLMELISLESLKSLYYRSTSQLRDFENLFDHKNDLQGEDVKKTENIEDQNNEMKQLCEEYQIDLTDCANYRQYLKNRVLKVEKAVQNNFKLLKPILIKDIGIEQMAVKDKEMSFWDKLEMLIEKQHLFIFDTPRMRGTTNKTLSHSYQIFDHKDYKVAKQIYSQILDQEHQDAIDKKNRPPQQLVKPLLSKKSLKKAKTMRKQNTIKSSVSRLNTISEGKSIKTKKTVTIQEGNEFSEISQSISISEEERKRDLKEQEHGHGNGHGHAHEDGHQCSESSEYEYEVMTAKKSKTKAEKSFDPRLHRMATQMVQKHKTAKLGLKKNESGLITLPNKGSRLRALIGSSELVGLPSQQLEENKPSEKLKVSVGEDIYNNSQQME